MSPSLHTFLRHYAEIFHTEFLPNRTQSAGSTSSQFSRKLRSIDSVCEKPSHSKVESHEGSINGSVAVLRCVTVGFGFNSGKQ
jgi:hypothetical protein